MDLRLRVTSVEVRAGNVYEVDVTASGVDESSVLDNFKLSDIIDHFGEEELLEFIGRDTVKDHFDLHE